MKEESEVQQGYLCYFFSKKHMQAFHAGQPACKACIPCASSTDVSLARYSIVMLLCVWNIPTSEAAFPFTCNLSLRHTLTSLEKNSVCLECLSGRNNNVMTSL